MGEETALGKQNLSPAACSSEIQFFFKPPYNFIHFFGSTRSFSRISCIKRTLRLINHQTINKLNKTSDKLHFKSNFSFYLNLPIQEEADKCYCDSQLTEKYGIDLQH